jgi:hypothetical protein
MFLSAVCTCLLLCMCVLCVLVPYLYLPLVCAFLPLCVYSVCTDALPSLCVFFFPLSVCVSVCSIVHVPYLVLMVLIDLGIVQGYAWLWQILTIAILACFTAIFITQYVHIDMDR